MLNMVQTHKLQISINFWLVRGSCFAHVVGLHPATELHLYQDGVSYLLVFQTDNVNEGWDGTYKGSAQPMEVYVYSLIGDFADGNKFERKGNITLLR